MELTKLTNEDVPVASISFTKQELKMLNRIMNMSFSALRSCLVGDGSVELEPTYKFTEKLYSLTKEFHYGN